MLEVIRRLGGASTVLFSTHILNDVERVCDRVAILDRGALVTEGPMDALLERYAQPVYVVEPDATDAAALQRLAAVLGAVPGVVAAEIGGGNVRVTVDGSAVGQRLLAAVAASDATIARFERQRPTLEDVFLRLVGRRTAGEAR